MNEIEKLSKYFSEFPGIGPRQAKRFVYFLLSKNKGFLDELTLNINDLKKSISICPSCFRFFPKNKGSSSLCHICDDKNRDSSLLMIVSRDVDFENIEKTGSYNGLYFVLGGTVPILEKDPENKIRMKELLSKIEKKSNVKEIILALSANPEGENTADFIKEKILPICEKLSIKISLLGRGLSTGLELEYSDSETLKNALKNRG